MKEAVDKVKQVAVRSLTRNVLAALENSTLQIEAQAMQFTNVQLPPIREESQAIAERFMTNLNDYFDALTTLKAKDTDVSDYGKLSLVDHDYLEAIIAMEGMVNHARNSDIQQYISFTTRLDSIFPNLRIDETNNPLDPEQIGDCFNEAIRPLGLKAHYLLTIYREFNKAVFHHLEEVLADANEVLIKLEVLPKLDIKARNKELQKAKRAASRPTTDAETRAFSDIETSKVQKQTQKKETESKAEQPNVEMFAMMQTLVKGLAGQGDALPINPPTANPESTTQTEDILAEQQNLQKQHTQLMATLSDIQNRLNLSDTSIGAEENSIDSNFVSESISKTLEENGSQNGIEAIDVQSSDIINLVTLLYKAIWNDDSLPLVMKELIGRTQISIMKIALSDTSFFDDEQHPARVILNEFAMAGIAWTERDMLGNDPVFSKVRDLVERLLAEENPDKNFVQALINELREFKSKHSRTDAVLEQKIRETDDHSERLDDVHEFVSQKINERVLRDDLDPSIQKLLDTHFHEFLVKLVLKEGPGGSSWKPVMSTIDVLLWTVKADKLPGDKNRFEKINPRLLDNLEKALEIGDASKSKRTKIVRQLKQVQQYSFHMAETREPGAVSSSSGNDSESTTHAETKRQRREPPPLPRNDPHLRQVDKLPIGTWMEFKGAAGFPIRCTLAAKIDSIDKLFFVNSKGVKVVELTRMRLARELKAGSVKIVSAGALVDRALESVISNLREAPAKAAKETKPSPNQS